MTPRSFQDFAPGVRAEYGAYEVTREAILAFAREFDPQPFHLDEGAAETSLLGGLCASGWHTAGMMMRLNADHLLAHVRSLGGPGVDEVRWAKPVRPGDVLHVRMVCEAARLSKSRPGVGLVTLAFELVNQNGAIVMTQRNTIMLDAS